MTYFIQIIIMFFAILSINLNTKVKLSKNGKIFTSLNLVTVGVVSNIILINVISLPTSEITLTALDEKHQNSTSFEVKLINLEIDGNELEEFNLNEGKWMRNETAYYMWRDKDDTRQPNNLTPSISFDYT